MLEFAWPYAFGLILVPIVVGLLSRPTTNTQSALIVPDAAGFEFGESSVLPGRDAVQWTRWLLALLAWLLLLSALARPQLAGEPQRLPTVGRDLMLAVDISGSMSTEDMVVNGQYVSRLNAVKGVVADFVQRRQGDRVGLILFGTQAYQYVPLTFDLKTVGMMLQDAPIGIAGGMTAVGETIAVGVKRLMDRPEEHRILILLTDGANNTGSISPQDAATLAASNGVRIHTVGIGAGKDRPSGLFGIGRFLQASSDLDEEALQDIARKTGGRYFLAQDTSSLLQIYDELHAIEPIEQESETYRPIKAMYFWPLATSLALFMLLWIWGVRSNA